MHAVILALLSGVIEHQTRAKTSQGGMDLPSWAGPIPSFDINASAGLPVPPGVSHSTAHAERSVAGTVTPPKRHVFRAHDSVTKPLPWTVVTVPPSTGPRPGSTAVRIGTSKKR